jgi:hypothetical protein
MRSVERFHAAKFSGGFGYSFSPFPSGRIYEGRGWLVSGAHTQNGGNSRGHGFGFPGNGVVEVPTDAAYAAARAVIGEGIAAGYIPVGYRVTGHRDWYDKPCPGDAMYPTIQRLAGVTGPEEVDELMGAKEDIQDSINNATAIIVADAKSREKRQRQQVIDARKKTQSNVVREVLVAMGVGHDDIEKAIKKTEEAIKAELDALEREFAEEG